MEACENRPITEKERTIEDEIAAIDSELEVLEKKSILGDEKLALNEKGNIISSIENARIIIENDGKLKGHLKYNELSYSPWVFGNLPWDKVDNYREWNNSDDSNLLCYIEKFYLINNSEKIMHALNIVTSVPNIYYK